MRWYLVLVVGALTTSCARSAPLPQDGGGSNPKNVNDASLPTTTAPSATATVDGVAAALSSRLAQISIAIGRLPVLSLPSALVPLKTRRVKVVVPFQVIINVKALKPAHSRRALDERALNPKRPRPTQTTRTTRIFGSTSIPVKVPVTSSTPPDNPKHVFVPSPVIKVVSYTYTAAGGGATTVVEAQRSRTHPGRPKPTTTARV
ncbi:hypothetical protein JCM9279_000458 [Rhodotorula babjevae]